METIEELKNKIKDSELKLENIKHEKYIQDKTNWHLETQQFLDLIINKCLILETTQNKFTTFKVIQYRRCSWAGEPRLEDFYEIQTKGYYRLDGITIMTELYDVGYTNKLVEVKKSKDKNILKTPKIQYWNDVPYEQEFSISKTIGYQDRKTISYIGRIPPSAKDEFSNCYVISDDLFNKIEEIRINVSQQMLDLYNENNNKFRLEKLVK